MENDLYLPSLTVSEIGYEMLVLSVGVINNGFKVAVILSAQEQFSNLIKCA